jgi:hypothetical protein
LPVVTRKRSVRILLVVAAAFPLLLAGAAALLSVMFGQSCSGSGVGDAPSRAAVRDIPARFLTIYEQVGGYERGNLRRWRERRSRLALAGGLGRCGRPGMLQRVAR